ncbi:MAG: hypothetical protein WBG18_22020 [Xanthobacteraceae bacterium]
MAAATQTTAMATAATTATAASAATATAMAASAATATGQFQPLGVRGLPGVFLVERVKCRQAAVEDFLIADKDFVTLTL